MSPQAAPEPIIISGTTGELGERRFCQFWGPFRAAGIVQTECLASMGSTHDGLAVNAQCPREWLEAVWAAYLLIVSGGVPDATHTVSWHFRVPTFTPILRQPVDDGTPLFDLDLTPEGDPTWTA